MIFCGLCDLSMNIFKVNADFIDKLSSPPTPLHDETNHQGQNHKKDDNRRCHKNSAVSC